MARNANQTFKWMMLATALLFSGCLAMMIDPPTELKLRNRCPYPIVAVLTYESGLQKNVSLDTGDGETLPLMQGDTAVSVQVEANGKVLYSYTFPAQHEILIYSLTPTGVTYKAQAP